MPTDSKEPCERDCRKNMRGSRRKSRREIFLSQSAKTGNPANPLSDFCSKLSGHFFRSCAPPFGYGAGMFSVPARFFQRETRPEIYEQLEGDIDYFVAGMGSTGTLMGCSSFFKEKDENIKIVGLEPQLKHNLQGLKNMVESVQPKIYDAKKLDEVRNVYCHQAFAMTRRLARDEGLFVGMSSGANVLGAVQIAEKLQKGTIVTVLTDRGDRYLSTDLFRS